MTTASLLNHIPVPQDSAPAAERPPHLAVNALSKAFETRRGALLVLDRVQLHVETNELVCIVGASGSGKSTLLRIIAGLLPATSGTVLIDGAEISGPGPDRGMIFQHDTLYPWLTVASNIEYGLRLRGLPSSERRDRVAHYLHVVGLEKFADVLPRQLSGGMKQRAAIARALANDPALLLMDEPFGALDSQTRLLMQEFLLRIWRETHTSILLVTHDVSEAVFVSQRIYVFSSHPGHVKAEVAIPFSEERDFTLKRTPAFQAIEWHLVEQLHAEGIKHEEAERKP